MKKENESAERLKVGRDYVNLHDNDVVVIDRVSDIMNRGFERLKYKNYLSCSNHSNWREATEEEVVEAFKKHLTIRYGEDWETMKIKERRPRLKLDYLINDNLYVVDISKFFDSWMVWNKNGLLYCDGIWVERLEEEEGEMNIDELKIKALLEGLEAENIEEFMREAKVDDYKNYGKAYVSAARNKINEQKPLFITDDGVEISDLCQTVYLIHPKTFIRQKNDLGYFSADDLDNNKLFYHESSADEYVVWHKKWFSVNDLLLADIGITTNQLDKLHQMAIKKI